MPVNSFEHFLEDVTALARLQKLLLIGDVDWRANFIFGARKTCPSCSNFSPVQF